MNIYGKQRINVVGKYSLEKNGEFELPTSFPRSARFASNVLFFAIFNLLLSYTSHWR